MEELERKKITELYFPAEVLTRNRYIHSRIIFYSHLCPGSWVRGELKERLYFYPP